MPIYEGMGSDKSSVVLEIGFAFTRCGFASEFSPRAIIPSQTFVSTHNKIMRIADIQDVDLLTIALKDFLQNIYFKYLAVNPKDRRVVIVESVFTPASFRSRLVDVLFRHLDVPMILLVPHHVTVLCTLGINTGLILDVGYREAIAVPIVEGVTLLDCVQFAPLGGASIHRRIMDELIRRDDALLSQNGTLRRIEEDAEINELNESVLEDIKVKTCFVTTIQRGSVLARQKVTGGEAETSDPTATTSQHQAESEREATQMIEQTPPGVPFPIGGDKTLRIPGSLRESVCEVLFEMYGEEHTLPTLIIDAIMACPIDCRRTLASNMVLIGGTCMLAGFKHRLYREIKHLATKSERYRVPLSFAEDFKLHRLPCKENYAAWLGASIFATSDLQTMRSVTNEQYMKNSNAINDWSNCWNPGI